MYPDGTRGPEQPGHAVVPGDGALSGDGEPEAAGPRSTEPAPVDATSGEPALTEPALTEPAPTDSAPTEPGEPSIAELWSRLPDPLRGRLAEIAAAAVGGMPAAEVPQPLRRFARFTPAKRARLAGPVLCAELEGSAPFRTAVLAWWSEHRPGELETRADDRLNAAAAALLTAHPSTAQLVAAAERHGELGEVRAERDEALSRVDKLTVEMERLRGELTEAREQARTAAQHRDTEYQQLRRRVSEQGSRLRTATDTCAELEHTVAQLRSGVDQRLDEAVAERDRERERADSERRRAERAAREVAAARQAAREARQGDEVRLGLLLDTLGGAVNGLRRELSLGGGGPRPADTVAGTRSGAVGGDSGGAPVDDLAALDAMLGLPALHLVVDGYNVSKTGYPDLTLADQRTRLTRQLAALGSRTGIEVTVVFDGAAVTAAPLRGTRGVRVLFSDPGVLADDVVRDLVAAEPRGRPLLVATSDREVVTSVRRRGAHTVPSAVLLQRLHG
ncbi:putative RNA-binding protein with PIN domain [Pseudonocardia sediminis]|uniref:Putative RNA-binding protein with PIN domain n=1 Tax=Pseudonocardia sediminis TaxID=1397368 RepID=A0A4Q7UY42_PSEST|nr:NYN domain-containing protein [Pseudonocardia sediminis]RZT85133.1 putative RNA-binding protein with PIN domain [Pseudonocardia sediminis]